MLTTPSPLATYLDGKPQLKIPGDAQYRVEGANIAFEWLDAEGSAHSSWYFDCKIAIMYVAANTRVMSMVSKTWQQEYPPMPPIYIPDAVIWGN